MAAFLDNCRFNPTLGGTTDWTYFSAAAGYQSPAAANVVNGTKYKYFAIDASNNWELGEGAYNTSTGVLARTTILYSTNSNAKVSFAAAPQVAIVALKEDMISVEEANSFTTTQQDQVRKNIGIYCGGGYSNIIGASTGANTMTITADAVALFNSSGNLFGATSVSLTLNMASSGVNGLDTGSLSTTGYNYFVIYNPTTGTIASLASLSATAPTMPSGYTYKRRIGWLSYSSGIIAFNQRNNSARYSSQRGVASGASALASFSLSGFVPPTAQRVRGYMVSNNNNVGVFDDASVPLIVVNAAPANSCTWQWEFVPQTSITIQYSSSSGGGGAGVTGWDDNI